MLLTFVALMSILVLGLQFWFKPAVENELASIVHAYYTAKGAKISDTLSVKASPLTRTVVIEPFTLTHPSAGLKEGKIAESKLQLTVQGLLALSPLKHLLARSQGEIPLLDRAECDLASFFTGAGTVVVQKISVYDARIEAQTFRELLANPERFADKRLFTVREISLGSSEITSQDKQAVHISLGTTVLSDLTPNKLGSLRINDLSASDGTKNQFHVRSLLQEQIKLFSDEECLALAGRLSGQQSAATLLALFLGEEPWVETTRFSDLTVRVDGSPFTIGTIAFQARPNAQAQSLEIGGIALAGALIEEQVGQKLPIPKVMHIHLNLGLAKKREKIRTFSAGLGVDELFAFEAQLDSTVDSFEGLFEKFLTQPISNLSLRFSDNSLLARAALYAFGGASAKALLASKLAPEENASEAEHIISRKLQSFVERPGSLAIISKTDQTFTLQKLDSFSTKEILDLFQLEVTEGAKDLDDQITELQKQ